jgi:hypothetical protein
MSGSKSRTLASRSEVDDADQTVNRSQRKEDTPEIPAERPDDVAAEQRWVVEGRCRLRFSRTDLQCYCFELKHHEAANPRWRTRVAMTNRRQLIGRFDRAVDATLEAMSMRGRELSLRAPQSNAAHEE